MGSLVAARGLFAVVRGLLSSCGTWAPEHLGSVIAERGLSCLRGMSSPTRDRTRVPCIGRRIFFFFRGVPLLLFFIIYLFIHLFLVVLGLRCCVRAFYSCGEWGYSSLRCVGLSLSWPLLLQSTSSRRAGSVVMAHGLSCSAACGIFPDQGSNPCPLHWQADSQPLRHQGSPGRWIFNHWTSREAPGCRS